MTDPVSLQCGDRLLTFTGGSLLDRSHTTGAGVVRGARHPIGATLTDQFGTMYRLHGVATYAFDLATGAGTFTLSGAVTGSTGSVDTVNSRFSGDELGATADERGTCLVLE